MREWQTVAAFQVRELLQRRILWLLLGAAAVAVTLFGYALHTALTSGGGMPLAVRGQVLEQLLSMMLVLSCLLITVVATLGAVAMLGQELDTGRVQMVISRPLHRRAVYLGHYAGLALVLGAFAGLLYLAVLLVFGWQSGLWPAGWWQGLFVFPLSALVQVGLTLWLATRMASLAAGVAGLVLLLLAWIGSFLELLGHALRLASLEVAGVLISLLLPQAATNAWVTGMLRDGLHAQTIIAIGFPYGPSPSGWMLLYALAWLALVLGAGVLSFRRREM